MAARGARQLPSAPGALAAAALPLPRISESAARALVLLIALAQGLLYLALLPPWQHYEEPTHFEYAWLIANRGHVPAAGEIDAILRREVAGSMMAHNFYWNLPKPDLAGESVVSIGGAEVGLQPPAYYVLASLPLRAARHLDITSQLYLARCVSLALFVLTVLVANGAARDLTAPGHPLRWALPLSIALLPPFADLMTAVNNDVGAVFAFSLFLWGCTRAICHGLTWPRSLWVVGSAVLAALMKSTAAPALALAPIALLLALWAARRWRWSLFGAATLVAVTASLVACFTWSDAAYWYRWPGAAPQPLARAVAAGAPVGPHALVAEVAAGGHTRLLLSPIAEDELRELGGQTVTVGGWLWSDRPLNAAAPGLVWLAPGATRLGGGAGATIQLTSRPTFVARTFTLPRRVASLHYALFGKLDLPPGPRAHLFLDGAVLARGTFPAAAPPSFDDETAQAGVWGGQRFTNLVRNASAEAAWPSLRPWAEQLATQYTRLSLVQRLPLLFNADRLGKLFDAASGRALLDGFFATFAWGHVRMPSELRPYLLVAAVLPAIGCVAWLARARPRTPARAAAALLGLAAAVIWSVTLLMPLTVFWETQFAPPTVRYAFPAILPTLLALSGGWLALWPRTWRPVAVLALVLALVALDALALHTIAVFYRSLPA
jgi:hypothetical protein